MDTNIIQTAAEYIGYMISISGFVCLMSKNIRHGIINSLLKRQKEEKIDKTLSMLSDLINTLSLELKEQIKLQECCNEKYEKALLELTRHNLNQLYFIYGDVNTVKSYDLEAFEKGYECYIALGGNSYMEALHEDMLEKQVILPKKE